MTDLIVDSNIRTWVFLPIVLITFLVGVTLHFVTLLISNDQNANLEQLRDSQIVLRSRMLRNNGNYVPPSAFIGRKYHFLVKNEAYLTQKKKKKAMEPNIFSDPNVLVDMAKHNFLNVLPMMVIGGWITLMFSGFITTKVPFRLTLRFKAMLQRDIDLTSLDAAWVSSASWYVLNLCGLRNVYNLILGELTPSDSRERNAFFIGTAANMVKDIAEIFKEEYEALAMVEHKWVVNADVEHMNN